MAEADQTDMQVFEDERTGNWFLPYETAKGTKLDVMFDGEQPWFTQADMAAMFGVDRDTVGMHIGRFSEDGELDEATTEDFSVVRTEGTRQVKRQVTHYSLDVAFYVGYRVNSTEGKLFRRWATSVLVQVATKGFVVNQRMLKGQSDRIRELRRIIADLRSEEANLYGELRDICAMCQDYDPKSSAAHAFYKLMQAKLFYAVVSATPAQVMSQRADAQSENMGLQSWAGDRLLSRDVTVGKNYLTQPEMTELNRLTGLLLDVFEDQLDIGRLTTMGDAAVLLDKQLSELGRVVLENPGPPSSKDGKALARAQYKIFNECRRSLSAKRASKELDELAQSSRSLGRKSAKKQAKRKE
ncbi:MAG: RhuM family protein [Pseudomonadota bacterium]